MMLVKIGEGKERHGAGLDMQVPAFKRSGSAIAALKHDM
jgi:hypothetical protein